MIIDLLSEHNLRGYTFEHLTRMMLRRLRENKIIFNVCQFDNIYELIKKYRLTPCSSIGEFISFLEINWGHFDLIEFILNNKKERIIEEIKIYEIKTKINKTNKYDFCKSNYLFLKKCIENYSIKPKIISIRLLDYWKLNFTVLIYSIKFQ